MKITDEKLSAFLDNELPEAEMEHIREKISQDESLSHRLAELAMVDEVVSKTYSSIDQRPIPDGIKKLLNDVEETERPSAKVIEFPLWQRVQNGFQRYAAVVAVIALLTGFGIGHYTPFNKDNTPQWQQVTEVLNEQASGKSQALNAQWSIKPQVSFRNTEGDYCRQFEITGQTEAHQSIACKKDNQWQLIARVYQNAEATSPYQTASQNNLLDKTIDQLIDGDFLNKAQESDALANNWNQ